ncbi:MAG TPA: V-type ATP synthase subunit F [Anaeromyxobacteraceae bacterium]|nr:V-type ATP synthase subunit F [Anaeromyxobacteraceae bacterium]
MAGPMGAGAAGAREAVGRRRLAVVVRPGDALGFRLAGVRVEVAPPGGEAALFRTLVAEPELGVLAVEEEVLAAASARLLRRARERGLPVILPFALPRRWSEEGRGRAYVAALIRRAVGYGVKLGGEPGGRERGR